MSEYYHRADWRSIIAVIENLSAISEEKAAGTEKADIIHKIGFCSTLFEALN